MQQTAAAKVYSMEFEDRSTPEDAKPGPARAYRSGRGERRRFLRWNISWPATLFHGEKVHDCSVLDFSEGGAQLSMGRIPPVGSDVLLKFPFTIFLKGQVVWRHEGYLGISFDDSMRRSAKVVEEFLLERSVAC